MSSPKGRTIASQQLISTNEAAELLHVTPQTITGWIRSGLVPYIELPSQGRKKTYRIPLRGLLQSLSGNYDLLAAMQRDGIVGPETGEG